MSVSDTINAQRKAARGYAAAGNARAEAEAWTAVLQLDPQHLEAHGRLARLLGDEGRQAEAAGHVAALVQATPPDDDGWLRLVRMMSDLGAVDGQIAVLKRMLELGVHGPDPLGRLARVLSDNGRKAEAAEYLRQAAEARPQDADAWRRLSRAMSDLGDAPGEISALQRMLALGIEPDDTRNRLMRALTQSGRGSEAAALLRQAMEAAPGDAEGWRRLARVHSDLGDVDGEVGVLERMLELGIEPADTRGRLLRIFSDGARRGEAVAVLRRAVEADPGDIDGWRRLQRTLSELEDRDGEIAVLQRMLELGVEPAETRNRLLRRLSESGRMGEAAAVLRQEVEADPGDAEGWRRLARLMSDMGDSEGEIGVWARKLELGGEDIAARTLLVRLLREAGRKAEAAAHQRMIAEADPDDSAAWSSLARLHADEGDAPGEIAVWERKLELGGEDREVRAQLVRLFRNAGLTDRAIAHQQAIAEADPDDPEPWRVLARLHADQGDGGGAIAAWQRRLELGGEDLGIRAQLVRALRDAGRPVEAIPHQRAIAEADVGNLPAWRILARLHADEGDAEGQIGVWVRKLDLGGENLAVRAMLVRLLRDAGRAAEAAAHQRAIAEADLSDSAAWRSLARLYADHDDASGEIAVWIRNLELGGEDLATRAQLVRLFRAAGRPADALAHQRAIADADTGAMTAWRSLARLHSDQGDSEGEIGVWLRKLALGGEDPVTRGQLVRLFKAAGRTADAVTQQRAIAEADMGNAAAWRSLARLYSDDADAVGEIAVWMRKLELGGEDLEVRALLVRLLKGAGRRPDAAVHQRIIAEADVGDVTPWRALARLHSDEGDIEGEIAVWIRKLELGGEDLAVRAQLVRLLKGAGRNPDAAVHQRAIAEADTDDITAWRSLARLYFDHGDVEGEIAVWNRKLELGGEDLAVRAQLVRRLKEQGRPTEAATHQRRIAEADLANATPWRALARLYSDHGDTGGAITVWERKLELGGEDPEVRALLVRLFKDAGRWDDAVIHQRAIAEADSGGSPAWRALARLYADRDDTDGVIAVWERKLELGGEDLAVRALIVRALKDAGRTVEAMAQQRVIAEADLDNVTSWRALARLYSDQDDVDGEVAVWNRKLELGGEDLAVRAQIVRLLKAAGRKADACVHQRVIAEADLGDITAWRSLGRLYSDEGDFEGEVAVWRRKLELDAKDLAARSRLAHLLTELGHPAEAAEHLRAAAEQAPGQATYWIRLSRLLIEMQDAEAEISMLKRRFELRGVEPAPRSRLVRLLSDAGRFREAEPHLRAMAEAAPDNASAWRQYADAFARQGDVEGEIAAWRRRLELRPDNKDTHARLVSLFTDQDRRGESVPHLQKLAELEPKSTRAWKRWAFLVAELGDDREAAEILERLRAAGAADREAHAALARLLIQLGRREEGLRSLREAADPGGRQALAWRRLGAGFDQVRDQEGAIEAWRRVLAFNDHVPEAQGRLAELGAAKLQVPPSYALETFLALEEGPPGEGVSAERQRIGDLLAYWKRLDGRSRRTASPRAEPVLRAVLDRLAVLIQTVSQIHPEGARQRWSCVREICAHPVFVELTAGRHRPFIAFLAHADGDLPGASALLDPALAQFLASPPPDRGRGARVSRDAQRLITLGEQGRQVMARSPFASPVLICGFHHSATRLLAQMLAGLGVFQHTETVSHEWLYIQTLNNILLPGWIDPVQIEAFSGERSAEVIQPLPLAARLAAAGYDGQGAWGHKDPRNSVTADAWLQAFPDLRIVNIIRNPMDVLGTLPAAKYARMTPGGARPQEAAEFWSRTWKAYLDRTRQAMDQAKHACELRFEDICADPDGAVDRLCRDLGLEAPADGLQGVSIDGSKAGAHRAWIERGDLPPAQARIIQRLAKAQGFEAEL